MERQREREMRDVIEGLPAIKISENLLNEIAVCSIYLSDFEVAEEACHLRCHENHTFHRECIEEWLKGQNQCPSCRRPAYRWTYCREAVGDGEMGRSANWRNKLCMNGKNDLISLLCVKGENLA
ncbi:NEP1-interacting protein-like 1 [Cryptomeria japonica]|uniref:NEP1-interacting protein-like 1 n=1 Tax=Cryptomeria japonica TaxID=3369 RepID=UPI0027DAAE29|nr:NEP1-interacting protein-like 1 [Cryptomeria japonica]